MKLITIATMLLMSATASAQTRPAHPVAAATPAARPAPAGGRCETHYDTMTLDHVAPAEAMRLKPLLRLAVVVEPREPYFASGTFYGSTPTIDDPEEWTYDYLILFADIQCGLVLDPSARVLLAMRMRSAEAARYTGVEAAQARANLVSYISDADYPAAAIRAGEQGTVSFRLTVGTDGRVTDCAITTSSGSATLDATTCRLMRSRARFTPARDDHGNPTSDTVSSRIRWSLPTPPAPPSN